MTNENYPDPQNCGPSGFCGACATPCFLSDTGAIAAIRLDDEAASGGPDTYPDYNDLEGPPYNPWPDAVHQLISHALALGCARWDNPLATCDPGACVGNYFCWDSYSEAQRLADEDGFADF